MEDLMKTIQSLPIGDKKTLRDEIARLIKEDEIAIAKSRLLDFEKVKTTLLSVMDIEEYDEKSRERKFVVFRIILANLLLEEGKSEPCVGRLMHKNHATVHMYKVTMQGWQSYPQYYKKELKYWNKIKQAI